MCDKCRGEIEYLRSPVVPMPSWTDGVYACCLYEGVIRECIHLLKYKGSSCMAKPLGEILAACLSGAADIARTDFIVPVPLHRRSRLKRGFNQSELLAREMAKLCNMKVEKHNLVKIKNTRSQVNLSKEEREANVKGVFRVCNPVIFRGKNIILIDDVCTTGATMSECARVLKSCDAAGVRGIVIAHGR